MSIAVGVSLLFFISAVSSSSSPFGTDFEDISSAWCSHQCSHKENLDKLPSYDDYVDDNDCQDQCTSSYEANIKWDCAKTITHSGHCPTISCKDWICEGMTVCCPVDNCGAACLKPDPLQYDIPEMPTEIKIDVEPRSKTATVAWNSSPSNGTIYAVQERVHQGHNKFLEHKRRAWTNLPRRTSTNPTATIAIKPCSWYEIRVAAINAAGSFGYSEPSKPFKSDLVAQPPEMPLNLTFRYVGIRNGSAVGVLSWSAPKSVAPIKKYTIFWSERIAAKHTPVNRGAVFMQRKSLSNEKKTSIRIKDLKPDVQYFMQVEAQSMCANKRLHSEKANVIVNPINLDDNRSRQHRAEPRTHKPKRIQVKITKGIENGNQYAKIVWKAKKNGKYVVSWKTNEFEKKRTTTSGSMIIDDLQLNQRYNVTVTEVTQKRKHQRFGTAFFTVDAVCNKINPNDCKK